MLQPEQMVGPYRVVGQIGQGGMATVYKGYHERLERFVAIKVMHQAFLQDPTFRTRFEREAKIIARLDHPHIVPVYDYAEVEGQPYLVMKYVEGRTLKQTLIKRALSLADILLIMTPIANALDYAHQMGILHRDIKPSNIILDAKDTPYLTDFGMARIAQTAESTISADMMLGTPQYVSPEQAMGRTDLDSRTDLYSMGVVLFELIVGQVPYSGDTPYSVIHDHIYRPLPKPTQINPQVTPEVEAVLVKSLAKNPAERYGSASEMIEALRKAISQSGQPELDADRRDRAAESLAALRTETPPTPFAPPPAIPAPMPKAVPAPEAPKRVTEVRIDLGSEELGEELRRAGAEVRQAFEEVGNELRQAFNNPKAGTPTASSQQWQGQWVSEEEKEDELPADEQAFMRRQIEKRIEARNGFLSHLGAYVVVNAVLWGIFSMSGGFENFFTPRGEFPWPLLVSLFWGAGMASHGVDTYFSTGERAARRDRAVRYEMRRVYGPEWYNIANKKQFKEVRRRVTHGAREIQGFFEHLAAYLGVNGGLWSIFFLSGADFPWPIFVSVFWGLGLFMNGISALSAQGKETQLNRQVERELAREMAFEEAGEEKPKRKREGGIRLTEDGELTDSMIEELEADEKPKRGARSR